MSSQQAQDEMNQRLSLIYEHILLLCQVAKIEDLEGLSEDDLSLVRWAFGISTH